MKKIKALLAIVLSAVMLMGFSVTAFADYPGAYVAELYKLDTYGTTSAEKSMGDPAVLNADVSYDSEKNETTITVYVTDLTYGIITGHLKTMSIEAGGITYSGTAYDSAGTSLGKTASSSPSWFVFVVSGNYSTGTQEFKATFTINIAKYMNPSASGDLVIYFPSSQTSE